MAWITRVRCAMQILAPSTKIIDPTYSGMILKEVAQGAIERGGKWI